MEGRIVGLHRKRETASERGLPKPAVTEIEVTPAGVVGDFNRWRHEKMHDDPDQALLVLPEETLVELRAEGWPIAAGDLGENLRTLGLRYHDFATGTLFEAGSARFEVTRPCAPCDFLYGLPYAQGERGPALLRTLKGRRGWYCRTVRSGVLDVGDPVRLLSGPAGAVPGSERLQG